MNYILYPEWFNIFAILFIRFQLHWRKIVMCHSVKKKEKNQLHRKKRQAAKKVLQNVLLKKASAIEYSNLREDKNLCRRFLW